MAKKQYRSQNVLDAARERISYSFDSFEKLYVSFSGGKDSSVMMHLVLQEAKLRRRKVGVLIIDLEAQYKATEIHLNEMVEMYKDHIDLHWVCLPMNLRNAVTNYEPKWLCWDPGKRDIWVRTPPKCAIVDPEFYPFFQPGMEFEEFVVLFGEWYGEGALCGGFVGIRADESLNRFRTIAVFDKQMFEGKRFTTHIVEQTYNIYPIYDWRTQDIWRYHAHYPEMPHNHVYDLMQQAGVPLSQQRLCQPYGDDQRKGLWLYHILEPETWFKLIARVNGANSGALYMQETGNMSGYNKIALPEGHDWKSFCHLLLKSLPGPTRKHYVDRFQGWIKGWRGRGYAQIPNEAPKILEDQQWAPSYRRLCKVLLRNDWWCKGLGLTQPKSDAYGRWLEIKKERVVIEKAHQANLLDLAA
jgi:predicted phosphoadenosine phosphosulfate sulfurtransferase